MRFIRPLLFFFVFTVSGLLSLHLMSSLATPAVASVDSVALPVDFEDTSLTYNWSDFDGGTASVINNPQTTGNSSAKVTQLIKGSGQTWAGSYLTLDTAIDFSQGEQFSLNFWSASQKDVLLKFEHGTNSSINAELTATHNGGSAWQTLTYDFTGQTSSLSNIVKVIIIVQNGTAGDGSAAWTFYLDDIMQSTPSVTLPVDFENTSLTYNWTGFDGGTASVIANPQTTGNSSAKVTQLIKGSGQTWAGNYLTLDTAIDFSQGDQLSLNFWSASQKDVLLKLEHGSNSSINAEKTATHSGGNTWQTLTYDFSAEASSLSNIVKVVIIVENGTAGDGSAAWTFYLDDITQSSAATVALPVDFENTSLTYNWTGFDGGTASVIANPQTTGNSSAKVTQLIKGSGQTWAGSYLTLDTAIDFSQGDQLSLNFWSASQKDVLLKLEHGSNSSINAEKTATHSGGSTWQTLTYDFSAEASSLSNIVKVVIIVQNGTAGDGSAAWTFYLDDIMQSTPSVALPVDFENTSLTYNWTDFDGGAASIIANPQTTGNSSAKVTQLIKGSGQTWAGNYLTLDTAIDFSQGEQFTLNFWSASQKDVLLKFEHGTNSSINAELTATHNGGSAWQTLTYDFTGQTSALSNIVKVIIIVENGTAGDGSAAWTFYLDDITQLPIAPTLQVAFDNASYNVTEGYTATITAMLNITPTQPVTVSYSTSDGTATAGADYTAASGTLVFPANSTSQSFSVATTSDSNTEGNETVALSLTNAVNATIGTNGQATLTINDHNVDPACLSSPSMIIDDFESGLPSGQAPNGIGIGFATWQDPNSPGVMITTTNSAPAAVPNAGTGNHVVKIDSNINSWGGFSHAFENQGVTQWVNQDWSAYGGFCFWLHGNGSNVDLFIDILDNRNINATAPNDGAERWTYAFKDDFTGWKLFTIPFNDFTHKNINNEAPYDGFGREQVHGWAFGSLNSNGAQTHYLDRVAVYGTAAAEGLKVKFADAGPSVNEGDTATLNVTLNAPFTDTVTVNYRTAESSATSGRDYVPVSGTLTFPAGTTQQSITIDTIDNNKHELNNERVAIVLSDPVSATLGFLRRTILTIVDNDPEDPNLIDDFEGYHPFTGTVTLSTTEVTSSDVNALPGQGAYEHVLNVDYNTTGGSFSRMFVESQNWSSKDSISLWYKGTGNGDTMTVELLDNQAATTATTNPSNWALAWSDEFNGAVNTPPNPNVWTHELGDGALNEIVGWGNNELQYYTDSTNNAAMDGNGNLVLTVSEVNTNTTDLVCWYGACEYTSARLLSWHKAEFKYGRIESRIKVGSGEGLWPAFWTLGTNINEAPWPQSGEIDIMEFVGREPNEVFGTIHGPGHFGGNSYGGTHTFTQTVSNNYHTFAVEWGPDNIKWYVDGINYHNAVPANVAPNEWVYNHPFFMLLNVAVGGNFGGPVGSNATFPQTTHVDYVRVYQAVDTAERFEATFTDSTAGWQQIDIPFSSFTRSATQPAGAPNDGLNRTQVWGYGLKMPTGSTGSFLLDQVRLKTNPPPPSTRYDVDVFSTERSKSGLVGSTVVYDVVVANNGDTRDTFNLIFNPAGAWPATISTDSVTLNAGDWTTIQVQVNIPADASDGSFDYLKIMAVSQGNANVDDGEYLNTTAIVPVSYGIQISDNMADKGAADSTVSYSVTVTNTGSTTDTFALAVNGNSWATTVSPLSVTLDAGASTQVQVDVMIPANTPNEMTDTATVTATSQGESNATDSTNLTTTALMDEDQDGVDNAIEDAVPNPNGTGNGDGNGDGIPDSEQNNVTSLPNQGSDSNSGYVTLASPAGTDLVDVKAMPAPESMPSDIDSLPQGIFEFDIHGVTSDPVIVSLTLHEGENVPDTYLKQNENTGEWFEFLYDDTTGAVITTDAFSNTIITLHFVDGQRGDADGIVNGIIADPGAPGMKSSNVPNAVTTSGLSIRQTGGFTLPLALLGGTLALGLAVAGWRRRQAK